MLQAASHSQAARCGNGPLMTSSAPRPSPASSLSLLATCIMMLAVTLMQQWSQNFLKISCSTLPELALIHLQIEEHPTAARDGHKLTTKCIHLQGIAPYYTSV